VHCLILGKLWPEPSASAAGTRTLDIVRALLGSGWRVSFACAASRAERSTDLEVLGVETANITLNDSSFDVWIAELSPDVVVFDRFMTEEQFGWRVRNACPSALRVLDTSDLHCLREARKSALFCSEALRFDTDTALREIAAIYRCDRTLMISSAEMQILKERFDLEDPLVQYWPFAFDFPESDLVGFDQRRHFVMIGSLLHAPNLDGLRWCKRELWPLIRAKLPSVELHCYGSYGDKYLKELNAPAKGFFFHGRAEDAHQVIESARVNLAPLRFGAGLKGKVFDGFRVGTPTVGTRIAYEGIMDAQSSCIHIADTPVGFANAAVAVYEDVSLWSELQKQGRELCVQQFSSKVWQPRLNQLFRQAIDAMEQDRRQNFVGRMLEHHQHRSTEYFSRWIEAKNQA